MPTHGDFMVNRKVTPAIEKFVHSNCTLTSNVLSGLIEKRFKIKITSKALEPYIARARAESIAVNDAKVEAVRAQILGDGGLQAGKYLKYLDENIEALNILLKSADCVKIETARDYVAVSQALLKSLSTVLEFVKPSTDIPKSSGHDDWVELRAMIIAALEPYPDAREAVINAIL
jgi:hypothetical protein